MRKLSQALMLAILIMSLAGVGSSVLAAGSSGRQTIDRITQRPDTRFLVWGVAGDWQNPDSCDDSSRVVLVPPDPGAPSEDEFKQRYAMTLGAHLTGRRVAFRVSGCEMVGATSYPRVVGITVY